MPALHMRRVVGDRHLRRAGGEVGGAQGGDIGDAEGVTADVLAFGQTIVEDFEKVIGAADALAGAYLSVFGQFEPSVATICRPPLAISR